MANDGSVVFGTEVDESGLKKGLKGLAGLAGNGLLALGNATTAAVAATTTGLVALGKQSIETTQAFDSSMSQIAATLGLTSDDIKNNVGGAGDTFDALRTKAMQMGSETNFTAQQAAEGLNILAMSGYDAESSIAMIEDVLHLAAAGSMDLSTAAGYVSGSMKGFGDATKDSAYYADLMAKGATLANTDVNALGGALSDAAATAKSYNQTAEATTVALLRLAEQGVTGTAASTSLSAAMRNLFAPTDQAAGALKELGVAAYDDAGKQRDFNDVVNDLYASLNAVGEDGLPKYTDAQKTAMAQTIFGIQGFDAYNKMVATSTEKQEAWTEALKGSSGEAAKQYATMTDNLQGDLDILGSAFDGLKIAIGDELMPTMREFVQFGSGALARLTEAFSTGGIEGAFGELGTILSEALVKMTDMLPKAVEIGSKLLSSILNGLTEHAPEIISAGMGVVTTLAQAIIDNAPLVLRTGVTILTELVKGIGNALPTLIPAAVSAVITLAETLIDNVDVIIDAAVTLFSGLADGIVSAIPIIVEALPELIESILTAIVENLPTIITAGVSILTALLTGIMDALPALVEYIPTLVDTVISIITENLPTIIETGVSLLMSLVTGIVQALPTLIGYLPTLISSVAQVIIDNLPMIIDAGMQLLMQLLEGITEALPELLAYLPELIATLVDTLSGLMPLIIDAGITILMALVNGIINAMPQLIAQAPKLITSLVNGLIQNLPKIIQSGIQLTGSLISGLIKNMPQILSTAVLLVGQLIRGLIQSIPEIIKAAVELGKNLVDSFKKTDWAALGKDVINGIINGLNSMLSNLWSSMSNIANGLLSRAKNALGIHSPSTKFRDQIGKQAAAGIGVGFEDEIGNAYDQMQNAINDEQRKLEVSESVQFAAKRAERDGDPEPEYVETVINIDGKETARVISPYVSKEIAWNTKK